MPLSHLDRLEAESLHILREVGAEFRNPVMLYSIGKDSSVLLHLLRKAFAPAKPPIPLLHVDTTWKFREMIAFRDRRAAETGCKLMVHINPDGVREGIGPFTHGASAINTIARNSTPLIVLAMMLSQRRDRPRVGIVYPPPHPRSSVVSSPRRPQRRLRQRRHHRDGHRHHRIRSARG